MTPSQHPKSTFSTSAFKNWAEKEGFRIAEVARKMGLTRSYVSLVLSGKKQPGDSFKMRATELMKTGTVSVPDKKTLPNRKKTPIEAESTLDLHPKIEFQAEFLMDREGFTTLSQLVTWLVKNEIAATSKEHELGGTRARWSDNDDFRELFTEEEIRYLLSKDLLFFDTNGEVKARMNTSIKDLREALASNSDQLPPKPQKPNKRDADHDPSGDVTVEKDGKIKRKAKD